MNIIKLFSRLWWCLKQLNFCENKQIEFSMRNQKQQGAASTESTAAAAYSTSSLSTYNEHTYNIVDYCFNVISHDRITLILWYFNSTSACLLPKKHSQSSHFVLCCLLSTPNLFIKICNSSVILKLIKWECRKKQQLCGSIDDLGREIS